MDRATNENSSLTTLHQVKKGALMFVFKFDYAPYRWWEACEARMGRRSNGGGRDFEGLEQQRQRKGSYESRDGMSVYP
jgi:hypothetical protein